MTEPRRPSHTDLSRLAAWNNTRTEFPPDTDLDSWIAAQVALRPAEVAVVFEGQELSYRALGESAERWARRLATLGVGPESLVGVCLERSPELVVALCAVLRAGAAYLPLDPGYPPARLRFMLEDARVPVLLTAGQAARGLEVPAGTRVLRLDDPETEAVTDCGPLSRPLPDHPAYTIYTSGSTGRPKGVVNSHRGIVNRLRWMQATYGLTPQDRVLQKTPFSFDVSVWELFWPLVTGARLVVARPGGHQDAAYLAELIAREGITTLHFVPPMLAAFLDQPGVEKLTSIRRVIASGEALPFELEQRFFAKLPHAELHNLYGPTEAAVDVSSWACRPAAARRVVPIGRPIANLRLHVVDPGLHQVPVGEEGELTIAGVGLARGYLHRPALTAERFVPDPLAGDGPGSRLYRTGDLARWLQEGELEYLGRLDHQVKVRGFRIELAEIEAQLLAHPEVSRAVVQAEPDLLGNRQLVAYLVTPRPLASSELRRRLAAELPEHMVPAVFVPLSALPLSPNGKVDRAALSALGAAAKAARSVSADYVAPRDREEETLAGLWADLLGVPQVGAFDSLLELGAYSLLVTQVISRARELLGAELKLADFFAEPTVAGLAQCCRERRAPSDDPILPLPRGGDLPTSFSQERIWFLEQLDPTLRSYQFQATLELWGELSVAALHRALDEILRRHEIFRTTYPTVAGRPVQRFHAHERLSMPVVDLALLGENDRRRIGERYLEIEFRRPFDITRLPLVRWAVLRLAPRHHLWVHCEHHLVHDGWSLNVFLGEMVALYRAYAAGKGSPLPELTLQFADFAVWQRRWAESREAARQLDYWKQQLAAAPRVLALPTDRPRPRRQTFSGRIERFEIPLPLAEGLRALSRSERVSLFMTMETAFAAVLCRDSHEERVAVGSAVANRGRRETEPLIGMVVNNVVLVNELGGNPTVAEALARTRAVALAADAHQEVPFDRVVEVLEPERDPSRNPIFQASFSFHDSPLDELAFPGLEARFTEALSNGSAKFDLNIIVIPRREQGRGRSEHPQAGIPQTGITVVWEFATALFDLETIKRMTERYRTLLAAFVADRQTRLWDIPLLSPAEREQLLVWGQGNTPAILAPEGLVARIARHAASRPQALAVRDGAGELTYAELAARAAALARQLETLGVGPETVVALALERSADLVVAALAVLATEAAYLPLDPAHPDERLKLSLADARPLALLTRRRRLDALTLPGVHGLAVEAWASPEAQGLSLETSRLDANGLAPDGLAYVIYTSGSTGEPKGVEICRRGLDNLVAWHLDTYRLSAGDRMSLVASPGFDASVWELWPALAAGASLHVPSEEVRAAPAALLGWFAEQGISRSFLPTLLAQALVAEVEAGRAPTELVLRTLLTGGDRLREAPKEPLPFTFVNHYGPTEATVVTTASPVAVDGEAPPIGRPITELRLALTDRRGRLVPRGLAGELWVGGAGLARGYRGRAALTARRFVPADFAASPGERWYQTGDLARFLPDGQLDFLGRVDQ